MVMSRRTSWVDNQTSNFQPVSPPSFLSLSARPSLSSTISHLGKFGCDLSISEARRSRAMEGLTASSPAPGTASNVNAYGSSRQSTGSVVSSTVKAVRRSMRPSTAPLTEQRTRILPCIPSVRDPKSTLIYTAESLVHSVDHLREVLYDESDDVPHSSDGEHLCLVGDFVNSSVSPTFIRPFYECRGRLGHRCQGG
jgi:hypothetical protein